MNRLALLILITSLPFAAAQAAAGCPGDFDGDPMITTLDLLDFLALYGTQCE